MPRVYGVVDLFAGPGGLAEGFYKVARDRDGSRPFKIALSIEKDRSAHETLLLRNFLRQFEQFPQEYFDCLNHGKPFPDWESVYPAEWHAAQEETLQLELGNKDHRSEIFAALDRVRSKFGNSLVLVGGPPCQAYSLIGRARNKGNAEYDPAEDDRHFLYKSYMEILDYLSPRAFVIENVKGFLSSTVAGARIFDQVLNDLENVGSSADTGYEIFPVYPESRLMPGPVTRSEIIARAEKHGVPQARHRVLIVGIRRDLSGSLPGYITREPLLQGYSQNVTVRDVIDDLPRLRSGISKVGEDFEAWRSETARELAVVVGCVSEQYDAGFTSAVQSGMREIALIDHDPGVASTAKPARGERIPKHLRSWFGNRRLRTTLNHEARNHMPGDLARYFFAACFTEHFGRSPKSDDFPDAIAPAHKNWKSGNFADRFKVQAWDRPSSTVTSHISKDGHHFIHPDPLQFRSLTVREAARLQTFPDDYLFLGNRTAQFVQVGNAVPPYLAYQLANSLLQFLDFSL